MNKVVKPKMAKPKTGSKMEKPHLRTRKMSSSPASAFPAAPIAFPDGGPGSMPGAQMDTAVQQPAENMPQGAGPGDMSE